MSRGKYKISLGPKRLKSIKTKYRNIVTVIPVPAFLSYSGELSKYEARSMHGQLPVLWDRAEGCQVFDRDGNRWIDFTSAIFVANSGHSHPHIIDSLRRQLDKKLLHSYTFINESRVRFLKKLIKITPEYLQKAFLLSAGTEAVECAIKLMRMHGMRINKSKLLIVSFLGSMHGRTMGAEMLAGDAKRSQWIGYDDPNIFRLPFPHPWLAKEDNYDWGKRFTKDMAALLESGRSFNDIAGFMIESYQGWSASFYPKEYIRELIRFSRKHNIVVTFDEIQSGFGRTGKLFAYQHYGAEPDLVCVGKGISSSLPLSAVIGRAELLDLPETGSMSSTHSGNPLCCAAALANLEVMESENLIVESARKGKLMHRRLRELAGKYPQRISYVLGKGLVAGIIVVNKNKPDPFFAAKVVERAMRNGLLLVHTGRESIKLGPPLVIPDEALSEGLDVLEEAFSEIDRECQQ